MNRESVENLIESKLRQFESDKVVGDSKSRALSLKLRS
jgi:hypothetical protein